MRQTYFYRAMLCISTVLAIVVCSSVTLVYYINMAKGFKLSLRLRSHIILVSLTTYKCKILMGREPVMGWL